MVFVNHAQKFKWLAKRKLYAKADFRHLNPGAKRLNTFLTHFIYRVVESIIEQGSTNYLKI
jgi:hypothetical protein